MKVKQKKFPCPSCGSEQTIYRKMDNIHWCRKCGHEFKTKNLKTEKTEV